MRRTKYQIVVATKGIHLNTMEIDSMKIKKIVIDHHTDHIFGAIFLSYA
jgi:peptide deformylase